MAGGRLHRQMACFSFVSSQLILNNISAPSAKEITNRQLAVENQRFETASFFFFGPSFRRISLK